MGSERDGKCKPQSRRGSALHSQWKRAAKREIETKSTHSSCTFRAMGDIRKPIRLEQGQCVCVCVICMYTICMCVMFYIYNIYDTPVICVCHTCVTYIHIYNRCVCDPHVMYYILYM